jgi:hypothetical protein
MQYVKTRKMLMPNAGAQPLLKAGATQERTLEAVSCSALILPEAPSSAYRGGLLVVGTVTQKRRRPQALLHPTAPM